IMQAFAAVRPQEGAMRAFVVPGLVAVTGFHRRDDMHQAGIVATHGKNLGDDVLLADMALGNMFDGHASSTGQFASPVADAIAERFSKSRIVEDADLPRRQKCRHSLRITGPWQRAGDDDAVVAGEHPREALTVPIRQQLPQPSLRLPRLLRLSYPVWFRLGRLRIRSRLTRYPSLAEFVLGYVSGTPMAAAVAALQETDRTAMVDHVCSAL